MSSPFVRFDADGHIIADSDKQAADLSAFFDLLQSGAISTTAVLETHPTATLQDHLGTEQGDVIEVNLTAGQTYTFSLRGTEVDGIEDPYLILYNTSGNYITEDDDGGYGRTSQITYTPTTSGTYFLYASSWYHLDPSAPGYPTADTGDYTIAMWVKDPAHDAPATIAGAVTIDVGTTYAYLDTAADRDMYKIEVTEGMVYTVTYAGGISGAADFDGEPGENIGILRLYNSAGVNTQAVVNYETGLTFIAQETGTIYVRAESYQGTSGGYTIDVTERPFADFDPLESLNWDSANNVPFVDVNGVPTAYVYFAPAGENFGETEPNSTTPMTTYGWQQFQIDGVMRALEEYEHILGVNYEITTDVNQATFRLVTTQNQVFGARFYPQDPAYGTQQGIGAFNLISGRFTDPASLQPGGFSYAVVLHEFGHAHGVAHPHDTGGGSEVMLGVTASTGSLGIFDLNQGVYTVMSYNDGWVTHPDGTRSFSATTFQSGWSATLGAFDIAVLQARYGVHEYNGGNTVYELADTQATASYQTIWDSGGTDEIRYSGDRAARIDLLAATLDYSPTGGGVVSFVDDVWGGYTIANGVVVENASGGGGADVILGNSAANTLKGNGGNDVLIGREGADKLDGGAGTDTASYSDADAGVTASLASGKGTAGDANGDTYTGIEKLEGSAYADTLGGGNADDGLSGLGGNDALSGFNGADTLDGGDGDDTLDGGNHNDTLNGGDGNDALDGGNHNDTLLGGAGNDNLSGGNHDDVLNGGAGNDVLVGGNQNDTFQFSDLGGTDQVADFRRGQDKIDLSAIDAVAGGSDNAFSFIGASAFTNVAGQLRSFSSGGQNFLTGDVDGNGVADFTIQTNVLVIQADLVL